MKIYSVTWEIEVDANNAVEAAKLCREIQLDPESIAMFFEVSEVINDGSLKRHYRTPVVINLDNLPTRED